MIFNINDRLKDLYYNNKKSNLKASNPQDAVDELSGKVDKIASNQIPDEYLKKSVDEYVNNNSGGFATQTDVSQLSSEIVNTNNNIVMLAENDKIEYIPINFVHDSLDLTTGELAGGIVYAMEKNKEPLLLLSDEVTVKIADGYKIRGCIYDENKTYVNWFNWIEGKSKPVILCNRKGCYVNFYLAVSDGSLIDLESIPENVVIISFDNMTNVEQTKGIINDITNSVSNNIIKPDAFSTINGYYDFNDGVTYVSDTSIQTFVTPYYIDVDNVNNLHIITNYVNVSSIFLIYCYSDDEYLGFVNTKFKESGKFSLALKEGTTKVRFYTNALNFTDYLICVSTKLLEEYEDYHIKYYIKKEALPEQTKKFTNKVIVNFGDSIFGNKRPPNDISTMLANLSGATVYNLGFGGCRMSKHDNNWDAFSMYRLAYAVTSGDFSLQNSVDVDKVNGMPSYFKETRELLKSIDFNEVDIITISYGTNDWTAGKTLDDVENLYDVNTYSGALRYSIETILEKYPHLKIFICGQTYRFWMNSNHEFIEDSDTKATTNGVKLTDFVEKTREVASNYHLKFIDNYYELGINKYNRVYYFPTNDGTHHNTNGAELIAEYMLNELY